MSVTIAMAISLTIACIIIYLSTDPLKNAPEFVKKSHDLFIQEIGHKPVAWGKIEFPASNAAEGDHYFFVYSNNVNELVIATSLPEELIKNSPYLWITTGSWSTSEPDKSFACNTLITHQAWIKGKTNLPKFLDQITGVGRFTIEKYF